ncbi:MAG: hypothetical protein R3Y44_04505 [Rikenellaceae bacterium]
MESSKFMEQKLNEWQRLESVIEWANMTTNYFARYIGLARGENLYQIKKGNNRISRKIAIMITEKFPEVNMLWLLKGEGQMLSGADYAAGSIPLYNTGVEQSIRQVGQMEPAEQMVLPSNIDCDFGMPYLGAAMGMKTPTNTILLLKKIMPEMIIPGDECVIVTKKIVLLRIASCEEVENSTPRLRLVAIDSENFGDIMVNLDEIEEAYKVKGKILTNI